jgi:arabinogalactan oligomer/maltooligosaccharide transport system permease protein
MKLFKKKDKLYLSDKPPLTLGGKILIGITYLILLFWAFIVIWPIYQIVQSSFNGAQEAYIIIDTSAEYVFSFRFFKVLFEETLFIKWVQNTLFIALSTAFITVVIVSFTGYAYSRYRFKGRKPSLMAIMLIQTIPAFAGIVAYYTMHSIIVQSIAPFFTRQMMLILIYSAGGIAGNTFILKGYLDSISMELDEAAKIDGCSSIQVYRLIIMPIAKPMLSIIALWSFIGPFMDFMLPRILLTNVESYTLAAGLFTLISDIRTMQQPVFAAGGVLTAVPIVIMFALLQKNLISGLAKGAVKG